MKFASVFGLACAAFAAVSAVPITHDEIEANSTQGLRLLSLEEGVDPVWKTEDEKLELMRAGVQFFDVTNTWEYKAARIAEVSKKLKPLVTFPTPSKTSVIKPLTSQLSTTRMNTYLTNLTAFNNRYYTSTTGESASNYILNLVSGFATGDVDVSLFDHSWRQSSIIAKIPGTKAQSPVTILGAHMDSINLSNPSSGRAPGADDDGSGTVNLIEIFRVLMANGFAPATPVEFHWYSGEEAGLLGSQDIAATYDADGVTVKAFMELDMTAYFKPGSAEVIALEADYIDAGLNTWLKKLIPLHSSLTVTMDTKCGYACSDHASWYEYGWPTSMPFEAVTGNDNPVIHGSGDTTAVSGFSWAHSLEFAKVALAFVYEMSA
ncbi:Zn-dependent exopeptidase [Mycena leptocephala]|nr:Zn-dependent exopeptidase [Mycena leptocephala]